jgi:hypothetical protein
MWRVIIEINQEKGASYWSLLNNMHIIAMLMLLLVKMLDYFILIHCGVVIILV